jgi:chaperone modulatory protein CbpM
MNTALSRSRPPETRLSLESFAAAAGLHPEFVLRLVSLGLIEAGSGSPRDPGQGPQAGSGPGATGELWFSPAQLAVAARIQRLRSGLALNYAALGLVIDLLDRVSELESALRKAKRGERSWTRTV